MEMKRRGFILFWILAIFWMATSAFAYTINDNTLVNSYRGYSSYTWNGSQWHDVVGDPNIFNVFGIDVTFSSGNLIFDLYTNFDSDGKYLYSGRWFYLADLALDVNLDGTYEYGIVLLDHDNWTQTPLPTKPNLDVGLYSVTSWDTSQYFTGGTGWIYGGLANQGSPHVSYVAIAGGDKIDNLVAGPIPTTIGTNPGYKWSVTIPTEHLIGLENEIGIFWGGMTCSNDAIEGSAPIPEPATLILLGSGLAGLGLFGRRKFRIRKS